MASADLAFRSAVPCPKKSHRRNVRVCDACFLEKRGYEGFIGEIENPQEVCPWVSRQGDLRFGRWMVLIGVFVVRRLTIASAVARPMVSPNVFTNGWTKW